MTADDMTDLPAVPVAVTSEAPPWAIRMEAKIDVALAQHTARLDNHAGTLDDHEARLREVERRRTVSPWQLWLAVSGGVATLAAIIGVLSPLIF